MWKQRLFSITLFAMAIAGLVVAPLILRYLGLAVTLMNLVAVATLVAHGAMRWKPLSRPGTVPLGLVLLPALSVVVLVFTVTSFDWYLEGTGFRYYAARVVMLTLAFLACLAYLERHQRREVKETDDG